HLGRLETRVVRNEAALELRRYLGNPPMRIERGIYNDLLEIARRHATSEVVVEKAVDVMLAVDMVTMGERNEFDAAYLLSADGDFTPAVQAVRALRKRVYAVSPSYGAQLAAAVDSFIRLGATWFRDCYR
ncbi:MAG: NYN domain-containing protein, partial [Gemmatimonadetes bacterium]|nr:NYN domain-containing protein [Gemmatimonadota bacterium]